MSYYKGAFEYSLSIHLHTEAWLGIISNYFWIITITDVLNIKWTFYIQIILLI